jgi:SDR family mycofactocin-dependent oxidoreductase
VRAASGIEAGAGDNWPVGRLDGRVALITGAARGQGRAIAAKFAAEGADLLLCDICAQLESVRYPMGTVDELDETVALVRSHGRDCIAEIADVRDLDALEAVVAKGVERFGRLDAVCANAGIVSFKGFLELSRDAWDEMIAVNLTGVFNTVRAAAPPMIERGHGSVVLTSSTNAVEGGQGLSHYTAAKAGVLGLLQAFALELAPFGIRVNAVLPGPVLTPMTDNAQVRLYATGRRDATTDDLAEATRSWVALAGRHALPASAVADTAIWLASDESLNVTGVQIPVDAGHLVLPGHNHAPVREGAAFDHATSALAATDSG